MDNNNVITIRLSENAIIAYNHLKKLKKHPAKLLRQGGEQLVIEMAQKNRLVLEKVKLPF
jgi:hypothetical protein